MGRLVSHSMDGSRSSGYWEMSLSDSRPGRLPCHATGLSRVDEMTRTTRLAIDASAARMGGGASRTAELAVTLGKIAPEHQYLFALSPGLAERLPELPPRSRVVSVPNRL